MLHKKGEVTRIDVVRGEDTEKEDDKKEENK